MEWLLDPLTLLVALGLAGLALMVNRSRGYSVAAAGLIASGVVVAMLGVRWATFLGSDALGAALLAGLGATIWTTAVERGRPARAPREA